MPTGMSNFIDTFFRVEETRMARQRQAMLERESRTNQARTAIEMAQMVTSPTGREALVAMLDDPDMGPAIMESVPGVGALGRFAAMRGFEALPEDDRDTLTREATFSEFAGRPPEQVAMGQFLSELAETPLSEDLQEQLGRAFLTRTAAGTTPGALAVDSALAGLPEEELEAAARIGAGTGLSAFQMEQVADMAARHNVNMTALAQQGALGILSLMVQMERDRLAMDASAQRELDISANLLFENIGQSLAAIAQNPESDQEFLAQIDRYNNAIIQLTRMGLLFQDNEGNPILPLMPRDPRQIRGGWRDWYVARQIRDFWRRIFGRGRAGDEAIRQFEQFMQPEIAGPRPPDMPDLGAPTMSPQDFQEFMNDYMQNLLRGMPDG